LTWRRPLGGRNSLAWNPARTDNEAKSGGWTMPILSVCPTCGFRIIISKRNLGQQTRCRRCGSSFFPGGRPPGAIVPSSETFFAHRCASCGACVGLPTRFEGRRVKCPDCRQVHVASRTEQVPQTVPEKIQPDILGSGKPVDSFHAIEDHPEDWILAPADQLPPPGRPHRRWPSLLVIAGITAILVCAVAACGIWMLTH
jgi:DNA-directed RNA polymerase subunit RPC12/RpoP